MQKKITIAVDGFSSCGKSTLAKSLASKLNYIFIDTGAMYRAVTLFAMDHNFVANGEILKQQLIDELDRIEVHFEFNEISQKPELILNGVNVEENIRTMEVSSLVSKVAVIHEVRVKLVALQRDMGVDGGIVMDGRDIGSVVFPNAELKLFVTANKDIRAKRRFKELVKKNPRISLEEIDTNLRERDFIDTTRSESPLIQCDDAIVIDNSYLTPDDQLNLALKYVNEKLAEKIL